MAPNTRSGCGRKVLARRVERGHRADASARGTAIHHGLRRFAESSLVLSEALTERLIAFSRRQHLTPGALIQGALALLLGRGANAEDVMFGSAFSGRPSDFVGVQNIVGPFINNLPLRISIDPQGRTIDFLRGVQQKLFASTGHQFTSIERMQDYSSVPWSRRLFDSLVVFQKTTRSIRP